MISQITIQRFKSLKHVDLRLGHLNLFIGTNASGKSNFLDALRVLQGIGYGFTIDEILNGKPKSATSEVWEPIRGGSLKAEFIGRDPTSDMPDRGIMRFSVILDSSTSSRKIHYSIGIAPATGSVREERLKHGWQEIFDSSAVTNNPDSPSFEVRYYTGKTGKPPHLSFEKSRPVLHQLLRHRRCSDGDRAVIESCIRSLSNTQRVDPSPSILREYSHAHLVKRMGERGENFAALVKTIVSDEKTKAAYLSWLQQLTPMELDDVKILPGALGEPLFALCDRGEVYPAHILSDGTLRFAAITASFFQPDMPEVLTIEEIENGVHPSRLRLLVELLQSQAIEKRQVMATTHSPIVLAWLNEKDYATTFFCKRNEENGESKIVPLSEIPGFQDLVKRQPITDLFAEGWLEGAL